MRRCRHTEHPCWACTIVVGRATTYQNAGQVAARFAMYEQVVEHLEALGTGARFRRPEVVRSLGASPAMFATVNTVVRDMVLHGLLRCSHRGRTGNCYEFEIL